jgi:hypothetical protein
MGLRAYGTVETLEIRYVLSFPDGVVLELPLEFTEGTFEFVVAERESWPDWTRLDNHRCDHCPLDAAISPECPLARALVGIVEATANLVSHTEVQATAIVPERRIVVDTTVGDALRSLMGLIIPTSGCPHTAYLRPMARFHLPFSSSDETLYRVCSMHRLAQRMRAVAGLDEDGAFDDLTRVYADINVVNTQVAERLLEAAGKDSSRSAVALLDVFAQLIPFQFDQALEDLRGLFDAYLR